MKRLSRGIFLAIRQEFGPDEILSRLSDPTWFQSLGCVIGFDWNSSGLTTITLGALKVGIFDIQDELGLYVCGGKRESRKTPQEIEAYSVSRGFPFSKKLIYASKMAAKVDSSLIQNIQSPFQLYQHNFIFSKSGQWVVIQQGMALELKQARRYHWLSAGLGRIQGRADFVEEPHSGIISDYRGNSLNLTVKESEKNRKISVGLATEEPKTFFRDLNLIQSKDFHWHPVVREKFDLKRMKKTIFFIREKFPENFEQLLALKGVGPKTIRALSLVSEVIYGARPSYDDPARYSFAHGGKDGIPYFPDPKEMDKTINIMDKGIKNSRVSIKEKTEAQKRLRNFSF